jgi:hypothetical protein
MSKFGATEAVQASDIPHLFDRKLTESFCPALKYLRPFEAVFRLKTSGHPDYDRSSGPLRSCGIVQSRRQNAASAYEEAERS